MYEKRWHYSLYKSYFEKEKKDLIFKEMVSVYIINYGRHYYPSDGKRTYNLFHFCVVLQRL